MKFIKNTYYRLISFYAYLTTWGLKGIVIFFKIRAKGPTLLNIQLPQIEKPIYIRSRSSDVYSFEDIFAHQAYKMDISFQPKVILDCGANVGHAAVYFANQFPEAFILAIEPDEQNVSIIEKNIVTYQNVKCLQSAIWNKPSFLKIENESASSWAFRVSETTQDEPKAFQATSIQSLCSTYNIDKIDILKMDIEGSEAFVFDDKSSEWLAKTSFLIIELHDRFQENCTKNVYAAIDKFEYTSWQKGENIFVKFNH